MAEPQIISPRGVPPIRPDWLIDVGWRLADLGLDALRATPEDTYYELTDVVDGAPWRFRSEHLGRTWSTSVEHDADLYIPTDGASATLRAGFQLTPWWEEDRHCVQVRIEIGPRGPVTFDPENWFVVVPLPGTDHGALPGVDRGTWAVLDSAAGAPTDASLEDLTGKAIGLQDLSVLKPGASVPELLLPVGELKPKGGLIGRKKLIPDFAHGWLLRIQADGPLEANWTGPEPLSEAIEHGWLADASVETATDRVTLRGTNAVLTLTGASLRVSALRLA